MLAVEQQHELSQEQAKVSAAKVLYCSVLLEPRSCDARFFSQARRRPVPGKDSVAKAATLLAGARVYHDRCALRVGACVSEKSFLECDALTHMDEPEAVSYRQVGKKAAGRVKRGPPPHTPPLAPASR